LYGGSVDEDSASSYINTTGVDGLLIGSASLKPNTFNEIIKKAHKPKSKK
jgi:triosephosphate isomerase